MIAQGLVSYAKDLREITMGLPPKRPNNGGVGSDRRFLTNISKHLSNSARLGHNYYGTLI